MSMEAIKFIEEYVTDKDAGKALKKLLKNPVAILNPTLFINTLLDIMVEHNPSLRVMRAKLIITNFTNAELLKSLLEKDKRGK